MPTFVKLSKVNINGNMVGPIFVNAELIVAMFLDPLYSNNITNVVTESSAILFVKETPEQIMSLIKVHDASKR